MTAQIPVLTVISFVEINFRSYKDQHGSETAKYNYQSIQLAFQLPLLAVIQSFLYVEFTVNYGLSRYFK